MWIASLGITHSGRQGVNIYLKGWVYTSKLIWTNTPQIHVRCGRKNYVHLSKQRLEIVISMNGETVEMWGKRNRHSDKEYTQLRIKANNVEGTRLHVEFLYTLL